MAGELSAPRARDLASRLIGLGGVFGKSLRDLRVAALAIGLVAGLLMAVGGVLVAAQFPDAPSRIQLTLLSVSLPPVMAGLLGDPSHVDRLGGFLSWRIGATIPVLFSIWSIIALSGTLAGEASRGTLEVVLAAPISRRGLAFRKAAAFVVALALAMGIAATLTWWTGVAFAKLPGDEISPSQAFGQFALYGVLIGVAGAVAFALGAFVGRATAAGIAGTVLFAGYLVDGFSGVVPLFERLKPLSWFSLTKLHRPLADSWDWPPVLILGALALALLAVGIVAFGLRDLASPVRLPIPGLPAVTLGTRRPFSRSFGDRLPHALAWGLGDALIGIVFTLASTSFMEAMRAIPALGSMLALLYPGVDYATPGGFLQIGVFSSGTVLFGLSAATAVSGWASDESAGRLDLVLAAPISRVRWMIGSGLGALATSLVVAGLMAAAVWVGSVQVGGDPWQPAIGTLALGLYMAALTGVGIAVAGLWRPGLAGPTVIILTIVFYLLEVFGAALDLPTWVLDLSLNHHMGQPMTGGYDAFGLAACVVLALGGLVLGTWGLRRRDLRG